MISAALEHPSLQIAVCFLSQSVLFCVCCTTTAPYHIAEEISIVGGTIEGSLNLEKSVLTLQEQCIGSFPLPSYNPPLSLTLVIIFP